jgi:transposase-like protein
MDQPPLFKWRHFAGEIIVCGVRWYLRYALSYGKARSRASRRGMSSRRIESLRRCSVWWRRRLLTGRSHLQAVFATQPNCETDREAFPI